MEAGQIIRACNGIIGGGWHVSAVHRERHLRLAVWAAQVCSDPCEHQASLMPHWGSVQMKCKLNR